MSITCMPLDSLNVSTQLEPLDNSLRFAQCRITFWGTRIVEIRGHSSCSLDTLTDRVLEAGRTRAEADDLSLSERRFGMEIESRLKNFYQMSDDQIAQCNFFTRILLYIREFSFVPYTTRFYLEDTTSSFQRFTEARYYQLFGGTPPGHNSSSEIRSWRVAEPEQIRALV